MSWLQTIFASLLGTVVGSSVTGMIAARNEDKRKQTLIIEGLASVRTELLIAANRVTSSILSARMAMDTGQLPPIGDDLTLMYRTHASILHINLSAKNMLFITVAYSSLGIYAQGRSVKDHPSQFSFTYGLYMNTLSAIYNSYVLLGEILLSKYKTSIPSEFPVFYLGAHAVCQACDIELRKFRNTPVDSFGDKTSDMRNDIRNVKAFADCLLMNMKEKGYKPTELEISSTS